MFSQACVKNSVRGGCMARGCAWQVGHVWLAGGACVAGRHAWQGAMCGRGHAWQGVCGGGHCMAGGGACMAGETATAADGTHSTGMHSCLKWVCELQWLERLCPEVKSGGHGPNSPVHTASLHVPDLT